MATCPKCGTTFDENASNVTPFKSTMNTYVTEAGKVFAMINSEKEELILEAQNGVKVIREDIYIARTTGKTGTQNVAKSAPVSVDLSTIGGVPTPVPGVGIVTPAGTSNPTSPTPSAVPKQPATVTGAPQPITSSTEPAQTKQEAIQAVVANLQQPK
jgi:hypothetical protein